MVFLCYIGVYARLTHVNTCVSYSSTLLAGPGQSSTRATGCR